VVGGIEGIMLGNQIGRIEVGTLTVVGGE